jgi:small subunit ribosomal protein S18
MKPSSNSNSKQRGSKTRNSDNPRKIKKKTSVLITEKVEYVDYKDSNLLQRFVSDRSKIRSRRVTGNDAQQQREITTAIKNSREMALLPYAKRVTTQRTGRDRGDRGDRGDRRGGGGGGSDRGERPPQVDEAAAAAATPAVDAPAAEAAETTA